VAPVLGVSPPAWEPHPDVWLLVAAFATAYAVAIVRLGPEHRGGGPAVTRLQVVSFSLGVLALWFAADWPVHDIGERFNFSIHMVQHLTFSMVAVPLMLLGTPAWLLRWILRPPSFAFRTVRVLARFLPAVILFNLVLVFTHWPALVNLALENGLVHFLVHSLVFVSAFIIWLPVVSPLPEIPRLSPPTRMVFLFLQSIVPTLPASFLTFGSTPLYRFYEDVPHLWGLSTIEDQQLAGLIMKIGAGLLLWMIIAVIFFRWAGEEDRHRVARRRWQDLDRELSRMGTRSA
jgi:putative membrane protein